MSPEKTKLLVEKYPNLYQGYNNRDPRRNLMCFGFECGDGWFNIIDDLSAKLEPLGVVAVQVKEKFGTLRFYVGGATDEVFDMIDAAEKLSETTCEKCGNPGRLRTEGWMYTNCDWCESLRRIAAVDSGPAAG